MRVCTACTVTVWVCESMYAHDLPHFAILVFLQLPLSLYFRRMLERLSSMQQETEQLRRAEVLEGMERLLSKARHQELLTVALAMEKQKAGEQSIREL